LDAGGLVRRARSARRELATAAPVADVNGTGDECCVRGCCHFAQRDARGPRVMEVWSILKAHRPYVSEAWMSVTLLGASSPVVNARASATRCTGVSPVNRNLTSLEPPSG